MIEPIRLQFEVVIPTEAVAQIAKLLRQSPAAEQMRMEFPLRTDTSGEKSPVIEASMINSRDVAKMLGLSPRTIFSMYTRGEMPKPVRFGRSIRWGRGEIQTWISEGCPPTDKKPDDVNE